MKKKIVVFLVITLLISATVLQVSGKINEKDNSSTTSLEMVPVIDFESINGGFLGFSVVLKNSGEGNAYNIYWEMTATGGLFFFPKTKNGEIDILEPGNVEKIQIKPAIGLGLVTIEFYCRYLIQGVYCETEIEVKQEWRDQALLIFHDFPENKQPEKEWVEIEEYEYYETDGLEVMLIYKDINNMHNARVVSSDISSEQKIEFLGACCFENGTGHLNECWVTIELVMSGLGYWEVELVDGE